MLHGLPLKAESLVVIIKDGGSADLQEGPGYIRGWGCLAQNGMGWGWGAELRLCFLQTKPQKNGDILNLESFEQV